MTQPARFPVRFAKNQKPISLNRGKWERLYEIRLIGSRHCERSEAIQGRKMPTAVQLLLDRHDAKAPRDDGSELPAGFGIKLSRENTNV